MFHAFGNNPINYVDPDGRTIEVIGDDNQVYVWDDKANEFYNKKTKSYDTKDEYVTKVEESLVYLKGSEYAKSIIEQLSNIKQVTKIKKGRINVIDVKFQKTIIKYNTNGGLRLNDGSDSFSSPALGLFHELSHSYSHLVEKKYLKRWKDSSVGFEWKNGEEKNAVQMTNRAAQQLGEPVRNDYISAREFGMKPVTGFINGQKK